MMVSVGKDKDDGDDSEVFPFGDFAAITGAWKHDFSGDSINVLRAIVDHQQDDSYSANGTQAAAARNAGWTWWLLCKILCRRN
jgi:hypothetical protein